MHPGSDPKSIELDGQEVERRLEHEREHRALERSARPDVAEDRSVLARLRRILRR
jgi:hypothetical protein